jgi:predicted permease
MLADSATPVALFAIGTVLWRAGQHVHTRTPLRSYLSLALVKLLVHPLLVLGIGWLAIYLLDAPLSVFSLTVLVLAAALPSASTASLLAERYGADNGRVTRAIVLSTALAFLTFSLAAWLAGMRLQ